MVEDAKDFESDKQRAEVFDALGHPTRIAILKALSEESLGFADLKKKTGIQSSGHLQHHINKLCSLVKTDEYGKYCLSDQGKDALLTVGTVEDAAYPAKKHRSKLSIRKVTALLLVAIIVTASVSVWAFDRIETHKRWIKLVNESFDFANNMVIVIPLLHDYINNSGESQRTAFNGQTWAASLSLRELKDTERDRDNDLALDKIGSFIGKLRDSNLNLSKLSPKEQIALGNAIAGISQNVANAYGAICNYTSGDGLPFWYFGPSSPDQAFLQEAADIAVSAQQIVS